MRIALVTCLVALSACDLSPRTEPAAINGVPSNLVLRSYDVPNNGAQRLRGTLKDLLWFGNDAKDSNRFVGRADVGPDGRLIVLAPESVHEGVKVIISNLASSPVKEPGTVRIDYWVVRGSVGAGELPTNLGEISNALEQVKKNDGALTFDLVEKLSVSSLPNERGSMDGRDTRVRQFTNVVDGNVIADIDLERFGQKLSTRVRIKPGVIAVLASAGMTSTDKNDTAHTIYFVRLMAPRNDGAPTFDRSQFEALFTRLEKPVFNVVYRWVWNSDEARDVTQEAFLKLWAARQRVRLETVEPFIFQSALNIAANRLRAKKVRRLLTFDFSDVDELTPQGSVEDAQEKVLVRKAVDALPEKLKAVVMLCEFSGLSTAQIAEALSIPQGTVASRRSLAMAALEKTLGVLS